MFRKILSPFSSQNSQRKGTDNSGVTSVSLSTSAGSSVLPVTADLAPLFECPVCFEHALPPIWQCQNGHLICRKCRPKMTCCPLCRGPLGNIRNLAMENVASTVNFPCKYSIFGCKMSFLHTQKADHEEICDFEPFICPCPDPSCECQGSIEQIIQHLLNNHKGIPALQGENVNFLVTEGNSPREVRWAMVQSCFGCTFMLVLEKKESSTGHYQFYAIVLLFGSRNQAEVFSYRLELSRLQKQLIWEAKTHSIKEGVASAILSSDSMVFDDCIIKLFDENGKFCINVSISNE